MRPVAAKRRIELFCGPHHANFLQFCSRFASAMTGNVLCSTILVMYLIHFWHLQYENSIIGLEMLLSL